MEIFLSFLALLLLSLASLLFIRKNIAPKWKLPPSPPKLPIIGNLHQLGDTGFLHRSLHGLSKRFGPVMLLRFGLTPVVIISSSEAAEEVLKTHDMECCNRPDLFVPRTLTHNSQDIAFSRFGDDWRERRKLAVRELFSLKKVQAFGYIREEENDLLVKELTEAASKQTPVNLSKALFWLTASIIFRAAFGQDFHNSKFIEKDRIEELVFEAETVSASICFADFFPRGVGWVMDWMTGQHKRMNKVYVEMDDFFDKVIEDHQNPERTTKDSRNIIDSMLTRIQSQDNDDLANFSLEDLKGILVNVFLAGIDTGAITMLWAMTELARHPKVMKKVQDEIRRNIGKKEKLTQEDADKAPYLKHVIKETFRLHPAAPLLLPRETMAHVKIQGYDIPPKTRLHVNAWAIGQDPKIWKNPEEFNPDRFLDSQVDVRGQHFQLVPFGAGRRMCPAMPMGMASVELGLLNLLYFFDWRYPEGMTAEDIDVEEAGTLTIVKKVPLELVPVRHRH